MNNRPGKVAFGLTLLAAALPIISLKLPLWQLRMQAPQYRDEEALKVAVFPGAMRGDLNEIRTLNQYIGVHIPNELSQLKWLPSALVGAGLLGVSTVLLRGRARRYALVLVPTLLTLALVGAAIQGQAQ